MSVFDTALQEWADYISFLGRLLKVQVQYPYALSNVTEGGFCQALQTGPSGSSNVPHTALVAKRLAQCLDPRLPSGVHQKALEVYAFCFSILGVRGSSRYASLMLNCWIRKKD